LVSQRPHLFLEKFGLDLDRVLHVFGLDQLVAEIESRSDIALHEVAELLGLVADRRLSVSVSVARIFSADGLTSGMCKLLCYSFSRLPF
jgi:hypothetical protein